MGCAAAPGPAEIPININAAQLTRRMQLSSLLDSSLPLAQAGKSRKLAASYHGLPHRS
jgi:hypothetical protein